MYLLVLIGFEVYSIVTNLHSETLHDCNRAIPLRIHRWIFPEKADYFRGIFAPSNSYFTEKMSFGALDDYAERG